MLRRLLRRWVSPVGSVAVSSVAQDEAQRLIALGDSAEAKGDLRAACEQYRKAVKVAPGYARAHLNLGVGLEATGDADGALNAYEAALAIEPANANASYNLGKLLYTRGELPRAKALLQAALAHKPGFAEAQLVLASVYESQENADAAAAALEVALELRPDWAGAWLNYGMVLKKLGRKSEAESALMRVMTLEPDNADAAYELANLLYARGALQEAEKYLLLTLQHKPQFPEAYVVLSDVHEAQGKLNAAAASLEAALKQRPDWTVALNNYGTVLKNLERVTEAEAALRRVIAIDPGFSPAYGSLGGILLKQLRVAEALDAFRKGQELDPDRLEIGSAELFALNYSDEISSEVLFAKHRALGERLEKAYSPRFEPFQNVRDPQRRLRIGYVSGEFSGYPVATFTVPLFERHDRTAYEIHCYSAAPRTLDETIRSRVDNWLDVGSMSQSELADTINRDGIDILVDLSGHSGAARLGVFAQQPAPVQVSWLGYLNTTGTTRIQYRLCDHYTDPAGTTEHLHTETLIRLPNSQWCYRSLIAVDSSATPPLEQNGYPTFGSFNQVTKLSPSVRKLWAEILKRMPGSRLVIVGVPEGTVRESLIRDFESAGVAASRITVVGRVKIEEYFRWLDKVDLALDTFPYSGGTTTCDALWMGVPVITVPGTRSISRSSASILSTVGLVDWVAETPDDYVRMAVEFARAGSLIANLRKSLRQTMRESPLMDEIRFARDIEDAYRNMWRTWCSDVAK